MPPLPKGRPNPLSEDEEATLCREAPEWLRPLIAWGINSGTDLSEIYTDPEPEPQPDKVEPTESSQARPETPAADPTPASEPPTPDP